MSDAKMTPRDISASKKRYQPSVETIQVPTHFMEMALRRTTPFLLRAIHFPNFMRVLMVSCYLQGLEDGYDAAERKATP